LALNLTQQIKDAIEKAVAGPQQLFRSTYDRTMLAIRVLLVGVNGNPISDTNRLPVDALVSIDYPSNPFIYNVSATLANQEYSQALAPQTRKFLIRVRNGGSELKVYFSSGATDYILVPRGANYCETEIESSTLTLYFQSSQPGQIVEIIAWST
jgi:hypothetical protein